MSHFLWVLWDTQSLIIAKAKELLYLKEIIQSSIHSFLFAASIPHGLNPILIHRNTLYGYIQRQISHCFVMQIALLWLQIQYCFQYMLYDPLYVANMLFLRITIYQHIIQIGWPKMVQCFSYGIINVSLEVHCCVCCGKLHYLRLKQSIPLPEVQLMFISLIYLQEIVCCSHIQPCIDSGLTCKI
jgi:hypothetical protein